MQLKDAVEWRYGVKQFDISKPLPEEKLNAIIDIALRAPSSMNVQPWKIIVVEDPKLREQISKVGYEQPKIINSPYLIVLTSALKIDQEYINDLIKFTAEKQGVSEADLIGYRGMLEGSMLGRSDDYLKTWAQRQTYILLGFLLAAAAESEVDAGPMEGFSTDDVDKILNLEGTGYGTVAMVALGYRDKNDPAASVKKIRFEREKVVVRK